MDEQLKLLGKLQYPQRYKGPAFPVRTNFTGGSAALVFIHPFISTGTCVLSCLVLSCLVFVSSSLLLFFLSIPLRPICTSP
jgi:hypothetical protein